MVEVIPFRAEHILEIEQQEQILNEFGHIHQSYFQKIEQKKWQFTIKINDKIQACCGVVEFWKNRSECWAIIDKKSGPVFLQLIRIISELYHIIDCTRIEATIRCDFKAAHRLVKVLGFKLEVERMEKYGIDGSDYALYSKVRL